MVKIPPSHFVKTEHIWNESERKLERLLLPSCLTIVTEEKKLNYFTFLIKDRQGDFIGIFNFNEQSNRM
jgi:hypothetical protein